MNAHKIRLLIPGAAGELIDKLSILEIKKDRISGVEKQKNIQHELTSLQHVRAELGQDTRLDELHQALRQVNESLWVVEDKLRLKEKARDFGEEFIELARSVYRLNDKRAALKREVNLYVGSDIVEEKSYQAY